MDFAVIRECIVELSRRFAAERPSRQARTALDPEDFAALRSAGFTQVAVPIEQGGAFSDQSRSVQPLCEILRLLGRGDPSVALVCAMHPAVLSHWHHGLEVPAEQQAAWRVQREDFFEHARAGAFFGTITSEPGSGGDIALTRATAKKTAQGHAISGQKHFGSGSGIASFMMTAAIPEGERDPDLFVLDVRGVPWDGSAGMTLSAPWDGHGMPATQSHGMSFREFPAQRIAWPGHRELLSSRASAFMGCLFASVIAGVVDSALEIAHAQINGRRDFLRPYEQVELQRAEIDGWLVSQALAGMIRAAQAEPRCDREVLQGKLAIAELSESCLLRLCRVIGGGSYSRRSAIGCLFEDVRALGFLRPPWSLAHDMLRR